MQKQYNSIIILGPTASGKTKIAAQLAYELKGEVISVDSRQVYTQLNIGAGKDLSEFNINNTAIPYHLIDVIDLPNTYDLHQYLSAYCDLANKLIDQKKIPILCGGSNMYLYSILTKSQYTGVPQSKVERSRLGNLSLEELFIEYDLGKKLNKVDTKNKKRLIRAIEIQNYIKSNTLSYLNFPVLNPLIIGIDLTKEERMERIALRLQKRFEQGLIAEVEQLLNSGISTEHLLFLGLEYKLITEHLVKNVPLAETKTKLNTAINQYAKSQMTWYRKLAREGYNIHWIKPSEDLKQAVNQVLSLFVTK